MDDATQNSKLLHDEQQKHTTPIHAFPSITLFNQNLNNPMLSFTMKFSELSSSSCEPSSWYCVDQEEEGESESDSCSEVGGDESDDEVGLEYELLYEEGQTKRKIEQLATMVGVDTTDPAIVLSEVVTVLKHLKTINHK